MDVFDDPSFNAMPAAEQLSIVRSWLDSNAGPNSCGIVRALEMSIQRVEMSIQRGEMSIQAKLKDRSLRSLAEEFPTVVDRTVTGGYFPKNHDKASVNDNLVDGRVLSLVNELLTDEFLDAPWFKRQDNDCDSENDVRGRVEGLLRSVVTGLKLDDTIQVVTTRTLAGAECDVLLVYKRNRLPFGTIEVKKPGSLIQDQKLVFFGDDSGNKVAGQIYDHMLALTLFGYQRVFGMITTWNHWRLVSTCHSHVTDDLKSFMGTAVEESLQKFQGITVPNQNWTNISAKGSPIVQEAKYIDNGPAVASKREIFASQIIPDLMLDYDQERNQDERSSTLQSTTQESGREILQLVIIFVLKALWSLSDLLAKPGCSPWTVAIRPQMACRILQEVNPSVFAYGTATVTGVAYGKCVPAKARINVIHHLGSGEFGCVCLGVSVTSLSCCAVKFFHRSQPDAATAAERELKNWTKAYGKQSFVEKAHIRMAGTLSCLVMPYFRPVLKKDRKKLLRNGDIKRALENFALLKCTHDDVRWRHFGYWNEEMVLFDLGAIHEKQSDEKIKDWYSISMQRLSESAGKTQPNFRDKSRSNPCVSLPLNTPFKTPTSTRPNTRSVTRANDCIKSMSGHKRSKRGSMKLA
jgi:hypothetical protein